MASTPSNAAKPPVFGPELRLRVLSSLVLIGAALGSAIWGGLAFAVVWALAGAAIAYEWMRITAVEPSRSLPVLAASGVALSGLAAYAGPGVCTAGALGIALVAGLAMAREGRSRGWFVAGLLYAAVIAVVPVLARNSANLGLVCILWMFAVVWASDIAAYFTGKTLGGPKLWPAVSPKKTWSGFLGGTLAGVAAASGLVLAMRPDTPLVPLVAISLVASVAGQGGDLAESALKRHFAIKDSSHLIPGHGGFMDRLDAFWAVSLIVGLGLVIERLSQN